MKNLVVNCLMDEDYWIVDWYLMDERDAVKTGAQVASCAQNACWAATFLTY